jgi:hypothetical protein
MHGQRAGHFRLLRTQIRRRLRNAATRMVAVGPRSTTDALHRSPGLFFASSDLFALGTNFDGLAAPERAGAQEKQDATGRNAQARGRRRGDGHQAGPHHFAGRARHPYQPAGPARKTRCPRASARHERNAAESGGKAPQGIVSMHESMDAKDAARVFDRLRSWPNGRARPSICCAARTSSPSGGRRRTSGSRWPGGRPSPGTSLSCPTVQTSCRSAPPKRLH